MKTILKSTIVLAFMLVMFSCQKEDWTYKGPQYFEFSASENGQVANNGVYTKENGELGVDKVVVQLVKHSDSPVTVSYKIVPEVYYLKDESRLVSEVPAGNPSYFLGAGEGECICRRRTWTACRCAGMLPCGRPAQQRPQPERSE
ncbi:MAG: hypothetical protein II041_01110, partial [Bacteroidales bacterium]|nr:hypothetical protein [Bacteroidales bacterium]